MDIDKTVARVLCPWHEEETPSCLVNEPEDTVVCFGCGRQATYKEYLARLTSQQKLQRVDVDELKRLLKEAYDRVPDDRKGRTRCIDFDPAGSTYEFTEYDWSKEVRAILGYEHEPTGI